LGDILSAFILSVVALGVNRISVVSPISTLYVPPKNAHAPLDNEMLERLGMDENAIHRIELKLYARHHRADGSETVSLTRR
jgi:hypothetical protein